MKTEEAWAPPIPFEPLPCKNKKTSMDVADKDSPDKNTMPMRAYEVPFNPEDAGNEETYEHKVPMFREGHPEEWIMWIRAINVLTNAGWSKNDKRIHRIMQHCLTGQAKDYYMALYNLQSVKNANRKPKSKLSELQLLKVVTNELA